MHIIYLYYVMFGNKNSSKKTNLYVQTVQQQNSKLR